MISNLFAWRLIYIKGLNVVLKHVIEFTFNSLLIEQYSVPLGIKSEMNFVYRIRIPLM